MTGRSPVRVALSALLVAACTRPPLAPIGRVPPSPVEVGAAPASSGGGGPSPAPTDGSADHVVAQALEETSRVRQLAPTGSVRGVTLSRKEMSEQVRRAIDREVPPDVLDAEGEMLILLGVVPASFDYRSSIVALMSAELAGYYEPAEKTMYLASDLGKGEQVATLAHELVHALQDQHYDLGKLLEFHPDQSDAQTAVHSFAEGDATSAMLDQLLADKGLKATDLSDGLLGVQVRAAAQLSSGAPGVPEILKRSLVAPYVDGIGLVHFLRRKGGWAEVDRVWRTPPTSTEQLLHPEKLVAGEPPIAVGAPSAPEGGPSDAILTDVMGEQSLRLLLEEWLPRRTAESSASGWGGDRLSVFRTGDRVALAWRLRADTAEAAALQGSALRRGVVAQGGAEHAKAACAERPDRGPLRVEQRGRDVVVVAGPYLHTGGATRSAGSCAAAAQWAARVFAP